MDRVNHGGLLDEQLGGPQRVGEVRTPPLEFRSQGAVENEQVSCREQ
jgi:hypothetical protein